MLIGNAESALTNQAVFYGNALRVKDQRITRYRAKIEELNRQLVVVGETHVEAHKAIVEALNALGDGDTDRALKRLLDWREKTSR